MKLLKDLLYRSPIEAVSGSTDLMIREVCAHSKSVSEGSVFVAQRGSSANGLEYLPEALERGAIAIVCEELPDHLLPGISYVKVKDARLTLALMASIFFGEPSKKMTLIGITGTNGKTTIATLLYQLFKKMGYEAGLISTVKTIVGGQELPSANTTPDALTINRLLAQMLKAGATHCFMEVSSHGIHQKRIAGLEFSGAIFTNLTHDHLDYHHSFAEYRDVKKSFFDSLPNRAFALVNKDDKNGSVMVQNTKSKVLTYALQSDADFTAKIIENDFTGLYLRMGQKDLYSKLIGRFNAYNLLAIYGAAMALQLDSEESLKEISLLESVAGRFQYFVSKSKITAIIDYAHTPDALENILKTIDGIRAKNERLITVIGCGGDRDKLKRPLMAEIACHWSDKVILTSDNPRGENPEDIIEDMKKGVPAQDYKKTKAVTDRYAALQAACQEALPGDLILAAGKGHETYQEIKGQRYPFDDFELLKTLLKGK